MPNAPYLNRYAQLEKKNENPAKKKSHHTKYTFGFFPTLENPTLKKPKEHFLAIPSEKLHQKVK